MSVESIPPAATRPPTEPVIDRLVDPDITHELTSVGDAASSAVGPPMVSAACRRLSTRRLLNRARRGSIPVFRSVEDAVQAWVYVRDGYGDGWSTA